MFRSEKSRLFGSRPRSRVARMSGMMASRSAPVKEVGWFGKSRKRPFQGMLEPAMVLRPVPYGSRAARSTETFCALEKMESKYRPAPPRNTVLPSRVAAQAKPRVGENLPLAGGGFRPPAPNRGSSSEGLERS